MKQSLSFPNHLYSLYNFLKANSESILEWRNGDIYTQRVRTKFRKIDENDILKASKSERYFRELISRRNPNIWSFPGYEAVLNYVNRNWERESVVKSYYLTSDIIKIYKNCSDKLSFVRDVLTAFHIINTVAERKPEMSRTFIWVKDCQKYFAVADKTPLKWREMLASFQKPKWFQNGEHKFYGGNNDPYDKKLKKELLQEEEIKAWLLDF